MLLGDGFLSVMGHHTTWDNGCSSKAARASTPILTQTKCGLRAFEESVILRNKSQNDADRVNNGRFKVD